MVRACLFASGLPNNMWGYAVQYSNFMLNCMPAADGVKDKLPYEVLHSVKPHIQFLRPFGGKCYGFIPVAERKNKSLGARAIEGQYLGPSIDQKGFMLFIPKLNAVRVSRTCVFFYCLL